MKSRNPQPSAETTDDDERAVFDELHQVVEEAIDPFHQDGKALPLPTSGRDYVNKMLSVAWVQR